MWITKCILFNFWTPAVFFWWQKHKYYATSYSVMPVLLVACPYFCISSQKSVKWPWDVEFFPLSLSVTGKLGSLLAEVYSTCLTEGPWRWAVGCRVALHWWCPEYCERLPAPQTDISQQKILLIYAICYPCNQFCPDLHFLIWQLQNCS